MAELPLDGAIPRFKSNEDRMDRFINGAPADSWTTSGGVAVPSVRKFLADKDAEINAAADGILEQAVTAKNAAETAAGAANTAKGASETARDKSQAWAESDSAPGGPGSKSAKVYAAEAANSAADLLFRVFGTLAEAQAAFINPAASWVAIANYSPYTRYYERVASDPGSVDKFQSSNGIWFKAMPLPNPTLDFAAPVARSGNVNVGASDFDQVHNWSIPLGTTYTCTLPDPDTYIGRIIHIQVDEPSRGLLVVTSVDPIGKYEPNSLAIWSGESLTLVGRAGRWDIIGGRCKPLAFKATNPGADMPTTWVASSGWISSQQGGEEWALTGSTIIVPRKGFYTLNFEVAVQWTSAPNYIYAIAFNTSQSNDRDQRSSPASTYALLKSSQRVQFARNAGIAPVVLWDAGSGVSIARTSIGTPQFSMTEQPGW